MTGFVPAAQSDLVCRGRPVGSKFEADRCVLIERQNLPLKIAAVGLPPFNGGKVLILFVVTEARDAQTSLARGVSANQEVVRGRRGDDHLRRTVHHSCGDFDEPEVVGRVSADTGVVDVDIVSTRAERAEDTLPRPEFPSLDDTQRTLSATRPPSALFGSRPPASKVTIWFD